MNDALFIKMISKTGIKMGIIGFAILVFGIFIVWLGLSGIDPEAEKMSTAGFATLMIFAAIFILVGVLLLTLPIRGSLKMKSGKHTLINAIRENDTEYVLWIYEYVTKVRSGPVANTDHKIWIWCRDKKHFSVDVKKVKAQEVIDYLARIFPSAIIGYTKEFEDNYNRKMEALSK